MTIEEKQDILRDFGTAIAGAKRYIDNGNDFFIFSVGAWEIRYDRCGIANGNVGIARGKEPQDEPHP